MVEFQLNFSVVMTGMQPELLALASGNNDSIRDCSYIICIALSAELYRARICKPLGSPGIDFQPGGIDSWAP